MYRSESMVNFFEDFKSIEQNFINERVQNPFSESCLYLTQIYFNKPKNYVYFRPVTSNLYTEKNQSEVERLLYMDDTKMQKQYVCGLFFNH